jgi:hypothetical protein
MKTSSAAQPLSRTRARNSAFINQLATPGLGSLLAGRYVAGAGQLLLALAGFGLVVAWFIKLMLQMFQQIDTGGAIKSVSWIGEAGAALFALAWVWALVTSLSLLRQARDETPREPPPLPKL